MSSVRGYRMLEQACSPVSPGDATRKEEIHRLTRVTARGLRLPLQASNIPRRQGTQGQRQAGVGLWTEKVDIVSIEIVRRVPWRGTGVATRRARRTTLPSFLA